MAQWHLSKPRIPLAGAVLAFVALLIPVLASTVGDAPDEFEALIWLSALVPAFLLAYYRGWRGVALGFAAAMVVLTATQLLILTVGVRLPDWPLMLSVMIAFTAISLLLGALVERLHAARAHAESLALIDPLTSLPNRRYFDLLLEKDFAAAGRGVPLVLMVFDLDDFKSYNDRYGHLAGDALLRAFAGVLSRNTRKMNISARVGGEEFMSLAAASTVEGALVFVERVREELRRLPGLRRRVSVSVGVAAYRRGMLTPMELVAAADAALYRAKREGKDRAAVAEDLVPA
jgi:diguanylate cyclase (GGDEF)-like protein